MVVNCVNPVDFAALVAQEPLSAAEREFVKCMATARECRISDNCPKKPVDDGSNVVRAELIRFFAWGGSDEILIKGNAIALRGVYVRGTLNLENILSPYSLSLVNCHFPERVNMSYARLRLLNLGGSYAECGVDLIGANIGGDLLCNEGIFKSNKDKAALNKEAITADGIRIGGNAFLRYGFQAEGGVRFSGADVAGNLDCSGGVFISPGKGAFVANGVKIGGSLRMNASNDGEQFVVDGKVSLNAAKIGVDWDCMDGCFGDIDAESAKIGNSLFWLRVSGSGTVNLQGATADIFDYDEHLPAGFNFILDGFAYRQFAERKDVQSRIKWLDSRPERKQFSPQPFEHAAKVLFAMGHDIDAREVLLKKERLLTKRGKIPFWRKYLWRPVWDLLSGYGYRLLRTLVWSVMFIAVGRALFDFADYSCRIAPHQPVVMALDMKYQPIRPGEECTDARRPTSVMAKEYPDYPRFDALAFSLDVFIPVFALHQESHWYPQQQEGDTNVFLRRLRLWYWIQIGAGWILTSLLVLTITGLLRPRQSSGGE